MEVEFLLLNIDIINDCQQVKGAVRRTDSQLLGILMWVPVKTTELDTLKMEEREEERERRSEELEDEREEDNNYIGRGGEGGEWENGRWDQERRERRGTGIKINIPAVELRVRLLK